MKKTIIILVMFLQLGLITSCRVHVPPSPNPLITGIEEPINSKTNVEEFYQLSNHEITDVENILPYWIIEEYNINVFEPKDKSNVYIMYDNEIIGLYSWENPGSQGVTHICVEDINHDNYIELYLSVNNGVNHNFSKVYAFDTLSKIFIESSINYNNLFRFRYENGILKISDDISITKREVAFRFNQLEYNVNGETFEANITINPYTVNFPTMFESTVEQSYVSILFDIKTKYIGETYSYMGSSTIYGAIPVIGKDDESYSAMLAYDDDYGKVEILKNTEFHDKMSIAFDKTLSTGSYDLIFVYNKERIVLTNEIRVVRV